jgi:peptidoglycan/xylan/chitin deacetylase (PgdA/CDA1 family)
MTSLTIVMYHYIRDLARTRYPAIKGRDVSAFRGQMEYIARHYCVVTAEQVAEAFGSGRPLPEKAIWLTFDDGLSDHYAVAFPLLHERGWQGSFFPPARAIQNRELLDFSRIHFILAAQPDFAAIVAAIRDFVDGHLQEKGVRSFESYWRDLACASRFDAAEIVFVKRMLQHGLPDALRNELAANLFERFVAVDPIVLASELYMTCDQLRTMIRCGMYVGSHGARHHWLDRLDSAGQSAEIDASLSFLRALGVSVKNWVMCYPYGAYDEGLLALLKERDCAVGLTTKVAVARPGLDNPLALPRLDTNDLPVVA